MSSFKLLVFFVPCLCVVRLSPLAGPFTETHKSDTSMSHTCRFQVPCQPPNAPCCPNPCQLSPRSAHENNHSVMLLPCRPLVCYSFYMLPRPHNETVKNCTADYCSKYKLCLMSYVCLFWDGSVPLS